MWMTSKSLAHHLVQAIASSVFFSFLSSTFLRLSNAYLESCQTSKIKRFVKILIGWNLLTLFAKSSILDAWQGCEYASGYQNIALFFFWLLDFPPDLLAMLLLRCELLSGPLSLPKSQHYFCYQQRCETYFRFPVFF